MKPNEPATRACKPAYAKGDGVEIRPGMRVEGHTTADDSCGVAGVVIGTSERGVFIRVDHSWEGAARVGSEEGIPWARLRPVPAQQIQVERRGGGSGPRSAAGARPLSAVAAAAGQDDGPTVYLVRHEQGGTLGMDDDCGSEGIVDDAKAFTPTLFLDYTAAQISATALWGRARARPQDDDPDPPTRWRVVPVRIPRGVLPEADALMDGAAAPAAEDEAS